MELTKELLNRSKVLMGGKTPEEILLAASKTLEEPQCHTPWHRALNAQGARVLPQDPQAVCWSVLSAVSKACNNHGIVPPYFIVLFDVTLIEDYGFELGIDYFEQYVSHGEVLGLIDKALKRNRYVAGTRAKRRKSEDTSKREVS